MKTLFGLAVLSITSGAVAQTLDPIIFSSKQEITSSNMTSSHFVYEVDELEDQTNTRLNDLLKNVPGVEISQTGLVGGQSSVFIRGGESKHSLILIDGVKFYDPSNTSRTVNLSILNTLDIEKIEVLKGAQSVLYGSDAIAGVINIITKKGRAKDSIKVSGGYFNEVATENTFSLGDGLIYLNAYYQDSKFESVVMDGNEKDYSSARGVTLNHSIEKGRFEFESMLKFNDTFAEVDGFNPVTYLEDDDENAYGKNKHYFLKEKIIFNQSKNKKIYFDLSYNNIAREDRYFDSMASRYQTDSSNGTVFETEVRVNSKKDNGSLLYGINSTKETYSSHAVSEEHLTMLDLFIHRNQKVQTYTFEYGVRGTSNQSYGSHGVYSLGVKKSLNEFNRLGFSSKTGYKAPSVYEQKAPDNQYGAIGNEDLTPEKSVSYDLSYEYSRNEINGGLSFFYNEVEDFINLEYGEGYKNFKKVITKGIEFNLRKTKKTFQYGTDITFMNHSKSDGKELVRRPNFSVSSFLSKQINDEHSFSMNWNWKGRRFDISEKKLAPYDTLDLSYIFSKQSFKLIGGFKNIFDREYEVARGYTTLRRALELSLQYNY